MSTPTLYYRTSEKGRQYWSVLGDPTFLDAEQFKRGRELRASMTEYDWALQQVCVQLEGYGDTSGVSVEDMVAQGKYNWDSWIGGENPKPPEEKDGQLYYQYHQMSKLMADLLKRGFIELTPISP